MTSESEQMFSRLSGLDAKDAVSQASNIIEIMLEGTRVGDGNREMVRNFLIDHLSAAEARARAEAYQECGAFVALWATECGRTYYGDNCTLHPDHYDLMVKCGLRMTAFKRGPAALAEKAEQQEGADNG